MESTRPIRALMRGLEALTVLNLRDGATVSEIAKEIRLPRTTVYRILETLCNSGFVIRDTADDRYRLTIQVRALCEGYADDPWVTGAALPSIRDLCRDIVWPISIATLSGTSMMVRESTDHYTPLAIERYSAGFRLPLLTSAAGRAFLSFCPVAQRDALIERLVGSKKEEDKLAQGPRHDLQRLLLDTKAQGYATATRNRRLVEEVSLGVPVMHDDHVSAILTLRFISSAVPLKIAVERYLPKLRQCAAKIGNSMSETLAGAHQRIAPDLAV